jgi:hypothetical protein
MVKSLLNRVGKRAALAVAGGHLQGGRLDVKLGFALFKDRRIPAWTKLAALALAGAITALLVTLEIPLESIFALILPVLGLTLDIVADGLEAVALPLLIGALLLPFVAPRSLVEQIMSERRSAPLPSIPPSTAA